MPLYNRLPESLQKELQGHIQVFLAEKNFEGCAGLEMTDEIKVTIAAQACLLLLNRKTEYYPRLFSILVYPKEYQVQKSILFKAEHEGDPEEFRLGESWHTGAVVLAWDHVLEGAVSMDEGRNLVLHEFAHQLDQEDGIADGVPLLKRPSSYASWARILGQEHKELQEKVSQGKPTVLDEYGAKNEAEFFAVATELFFEKPVEMRRKHPQLYEELKSFYQQDPMQYFD